jgi:hypothetical protein
MKAKIKDVKKFIKYINLDMNKELFTEKDLLVGLNIELEHGNRNKSTNVTNNNIIMTGKIALAHLNEFPDYYKRLVSLESKAEKYWKNRSKKRLSRKSKKSKKL